MTDGGKRFASDALRPGMIIGGKFALLAQLGEGGAGVVFEAEDTWIGRRVALKVLHPRVAADPDAVRLLRREARAAARIEHPNIVAIHEIGQQPDGAFYIVTELLRGTSLRQHLQPAPRVRRRLPPMEAIEVMVPIMGALAAAHDANIVHRDLKPDNIFLARQPSGEVVPKLIDFGIAKILRGAGDAPETLDTPTDSGGAMWGTFSYMSPEQVKNHEVGPQSDVWAVGTVLFELLAGACPFEGPTPVAILQKLLKDDVPWLESVWPQAPRELSDIVRQALERDLLRRFRSMHAFLDALLELGARHDPGIRARHARAIPSSEDTRTGKLVVAADDRPLLSEAPQTARPEMEWIDAPPTLPEAGLQQIIDGADEALRLNALPDAVAESQRAIDLFGTSGETLGRLRLVQAIAHRWLGEYPESERCSRDAMQHLPKGGSSWYAAVGHLAMSYGYQGRLDPLVALANEICALGDGDTSPARLISSCRFATMLFMAGTSDLAERMLADVRRLAGLGGLDPVVHAWYDVATAWLALDAGEHVEALERFKSAATSFTEAGDVRNACLQRSNVGNAYLQLGAYEQAAHILRDTLELTGPMKLSFLTGTYATFGLVLARMGDLDQALVCATLAVDECIRQGQKRFEAVSRTYLGEILERLGDRAGAESELRTAIQIAEGWPPARALSLARLADLLLRQERAGDAFGLAREAMGILEEHDGLEEGEALIRLVFVLALRATSRPRSASAHLAGARQRLLERAHHIDDPALRRSFLMAVPENARTIELARERFGD